MIIQPTKQRKYKGQVIVIDDLPENLDYLARILHNHGYQVHLISDAGSALHTVEQICPDLILLDIRMPQLDGFTICQQLKAKPNTREIPVIFLSALDDPLDKTTAFQVGGVDYITKPFQALEVILRLENQLKIKKLYQELQEQKKQVEAQNKKLQLEIQERKKAESIAATASKSKSELLAYMNHEIRNSLTAVIGLAKILITAENQQKVIDHKKYLKTIYRSSESLITLINNVLHLSKIEAGKISLNPSQIKLTDLVQALQDIFYINAEQKGIDLKFILDPNLPAVITTDAVKLRQVLINLIGNGIKFTDQGSVTVAIRGDPFPTPDQQQRLYFEVEDTGPGIAPEEIDLLFQPYEQTQSGRNAELGTGLGLSISRRFVEMMGGKINVTSQVGQGSCFSFDIVVSLGCDISLSSPGPTSS
ncbi:ATP-binding protein [Spirulina sp. CS-785/01]|uniref:ATP-binding response regulator n=1 Tax=Spirulina sp. CS-785/01 TaxID=3021716 RepID=UPI00232FA495|nr:ATP-binding protein [Spirulina sp. CS-785/01]MDB9313839.1 ATP-binding protein [Spirulina sp. CS-785/01]